MSISNKLRVFFLLLGDIAALYFGLFLTLILRYRWGFYEQFVNWHLRPFTVIFTVWLLIFYIAGLYDLRRLRNNLEFLKALWLAMFINAAVAVMFFYLIPTFVITPKTNLFLFLVIFAGIETWWRRMFRNVLAGGEAPNKILVIDGNGSDSIKAIYSSDKSWMTGLGYEIVAEENGADVISDPDKLRETVVSRKINLIVISRHLKNNSRFTRLLYELLNEGLEIKDLPNFYELIARKIPLADLEETWFIENLAEQQRFYDPLKRAWEFLAALALVVVLFPLGLLIALAVKLSSRGPLIYKQARSGKKGRVFTLYKFRTMREDAEKGGARWAEPGDRRATLFGRLLRHTHLDELPQLFNIIKGDLSFVGPRPERPEFVRVLQEKIPYYEIRHLIKPGVTGWAQIHHRADLSEEDVLEKLQYDIYYVKNRSPILDFAIILKTIKTLFVTPK